MASQRLLLTSRAPPPSEILRRGGCKDGGDVAGERARARRLPVVLPELLDLVEGGLMGSLRREDMREPRYAVEKSIARRPGLCGSVTRSCSRWRSWAARSATWGSSPSPAASLPPAPPPPSLSTGAPSDAVIEVIDNADEGFEDKVV